MRRRSEKPGAARPEDLPDWVVDTPCWPLVADPRGVLHDQPMPDNWYQDWRDLLERRRAWLAENAPHITPRERGEERRRRHPAVHPAGRS